MLEILKVTNPNKIVTDKLVLKRLAKQGIDKDYVEFWHDYAPRSKGKEYSPYAKFYRDLKSNKRIMVTSNLPRVKPDGTKIEVGWVRQGNRFLSKPNLFSAIVQDKQVTLTCLNDQPNGVKTGDTVTYQPQLFLNNIEQFLVKDTPTLLVKDPTNADYQKNVLEWDYGICKRRLRIIEGRFRERWVFTQNPNGEVRIKHNQTGNFKLRFGQFGINDDEELVSVEAFDEPEFGYPFGVGASATYYPDAHIESATVDGSVAANYGIGAGVIFNTMHDLANGHLAYSEDEDLRCGQLKSDSGTNKWRAIHRAILLFDTSGLGSDAVISAVIFTLVSYGKAQTSTNWEVENNIYSSNPAVNTAIATTDNDYNDFGTTPFCDNPISYTNWAANGIGNDFAFNAAGIAAIAKTGITKLSARDSTQDVPDAGGPTWENAKYSYANASSVEKGTTWRPKLVVTYTTPTNYNRSASVIIGTKVTASRLLGADRDSLVKIGVLVTASRLIISIRISSVIVGIIVTATKTIQRTPIMASVIIGMVVSASKLLSTSRASSVIIGIIAMASVAIANTITSSVIVGVVATASGVIATIRSSTVVVGIVTTATKTIAIIRQSSIMVGIVVSVNFFKQNVKRTFPRFIHPFRGVIPNAPTSSKKTIRNRRAE